MSLIKQQHVSTLKKTKQKEHTMLCHRKQKAHKHQNKSTFNHVELKRH